MRLSVRYDNKFQIIELNEKETEEMWISLSLEGDELPNSDKERLIQDAFNEKFNKPEYNNWHKFDRHKGYSIAKPNADGLEYQKAKYCLLQAYGIRGVIKGEIYTLSPLKLISHLPRVADKNLIGVLETLVCLLVKAQ